MSNNGAKLLLQNGYLPRADARGNAATAPPMALMGRLRGAGSLREGVRRRRQRANENIALSSTHTLFALEHNRIVSQLPRRLSDEEKFQIARRIIGAEQQYITYNEFLPALGVRLSAYRGYKPRRQRQPRERVRGGRLSRSQHDPRRVRGGRRGGGLQRRAAGCDRAAQGVEVVIDGDEVEFVIPLNLAFGNPDLLKLVGLGAVLHGLGGEPQYKNDEMIDNQLRSVLFQVPVPGTRLPRRADAARVLQGRRRPRRG